MRSKVPYIETISEELVVTKKVPATIELALLLSTDPGHGMSRTVLGKAARCSPASVTKGLGKLVNEKWVHRAGNGNYYLTGRGEQNLADWMAAQPL
jgi:Mn-dependent DtxR family transcriptional regulator